MDAHSTSSDLGPRDRARFFSAPALDRLECLAATFRDHAYAPHEHETFALGVITAGCETWNTRGVRHYGRRGDFCFVNPGEVHDGAPFDGGYSYRMTYPSDALLSDLARDLGDRNGGSPHFNTFVIADPDLALRFEAAHAVLEGDPAGLAGESAMVDLMARVLARHAGARVTPVGRERAAVQRAVELIDRRHVQGVSLEGLAEAADLPRHRLIRAFRKTLGTTPYAALVDRRVRAARHRLRQGDSPSEAAQAAGFADQSHLTRAFKARLGVTPGAYRRAVIG